MTSVMRAVARPTGTRALRAALVRGGRILDERVLPLGEHLTVGPNERSTFVVAGLSAGVRLLEWSRAGYRLHLGPGMSGRVALAGEVTEVSGQRRGAPIALDDEARGRIAVGDMVVLFHFVEAVAVARPQLPLAVKQGAFDGFDWGTTCIAAFSFLLHFGLVGAAYSDFADTVIEDDGARVTQAVDTFRNLGPPPPVEPHPETVALGGTLTPTHRDPGHVTPQRTGPAEAGSRQPSGGGTGRTSNERAADIARQLREESGRMLATIGGGTGGATDTVIAQGQLPTDILDGAARDPGGARTTGNAALNLTASTGPVRPGGERPGLLGHGDVKRSEHADDSGNVVGPKKPIGTTTVAPPDIAVGKLPDAGRVVSGLRGPLRACYKRALDEDPTTRGTARVTATIGTNGEVRSLQVANGGLSAGMIGCVSRVVRGAQFSPPEGGGAVVAIPMTFLPQ